MKVTPAQETAYRILLVTGGVLVGIVVSMSLFIIIDSVRPRTVLPEQSHALFTSFAHKYIDEISPRKAAVGTTWQIREITFASDNFATVIAADGTTTTTLNVVFAAEPPNVRVFTVVDATPYDWRDAELTLVQYLQALAKGRYAHAAKYFGGDVRRLTELVQRSDDDVALLLSEYCVRSSLKKCLPFIITKRAAQGMTYTFTVTYFDEANEAVKLYDRESFDLIVIKDETGSYFVRSLPYDTDQNRPL